MFKHSILFTAIFIALCAGFFSVSGIGSLFIGAPISAMLMAGSLELGKLISVSFVYRYWTVISKTLRAYFVLASVLLMLITSVGIYGYLLSAYSTSATSFTLGQNQISSVELSKKSIDDQIAQGTARVNTLQQLRTQQENRLDSLIGRGGLNTQQSMIRQSDAEIARLGRTLESLYQRRDSIQSVILTKQAELNSNSKVATFSYVATMFNVSLDTIVKWFVLVIVLVFDPLSVSLILAYNIASKKSTKSDEPHTPEDIPAPKPSVKEWINVEDLKELKTQDNIPDYMKPGYDWNNPSPDALAWKKHGVNVS